MQGHYRSEEHTSELQSLRHLVCRLLLEKKRTVIDKNFCKKDVISLSAVAAQCAPGGPAPARAPTLIPLPPSTFASDTILIFFFTGPPHPPSPLLPPPPPLSE